MNNHWMRNGLNLTVASLVGGGAIAALGGCAWFADPAPNGAVVSSSGNPPAANVSPSGAVTDASGHPYYVVKADFTPLFRTGPQQPNGPDQSLPKNTLAALLRKSFGYSRVQLENGLIGYVATEDLRLAPPERVAPPAPVPTVRSENNTENNSAIVEHYSAEKAEQSAATSTSNAEALPDLPEPQLEPDPSIDKPDFRY